MYQGDKRRTPWSVILENLLKWEQRILLERIPVTTLSSRNNMLIEPIIGSKSSLLGSLSFLIKPSCLLMGSSTSLIGFSIR